MLGALGVSSAALADRPRGSYVVVDPDMVDIAEPPDRNDPNNHSSNIIYLNGCFEAGDCTFTPGIDSSVENRSSIIDQSSTLSAFNAGPTAWDAVVECVRQTYAPFDIEITDVDPSPAPHFEAVVAGLPEEIGMGNGVGGVAPFGCGIINNAVTYSFANLYQGYVPEICWTVAQESAHGFGLDHENLCADPMTYRYDCDDNKRFQDIAAPCGEDQDRECYCGGGTQNSYQRIMTHFGAAVSCETTADCESYEVCIEHDCVLGPGSPGGLGESCNGNLQCDSGLCGSPGDDGHCTEECTGPDSCPEGFECTDAGGKFVCWPESGGGGGGCQAGGGDSSLAPIGFGLLGVMLVLRRRRRRR
jgi:MYXO-CTERM domain-containing protein